MKISWERDGGLSLQWEKDVCRFGRGSQEVQLDLDIDVQVCGFGRRVFKCSSESLSFLSEKSTRLFATRGGAAIRKVA